MKIENNRQYSYNYDIIKTHNIKPAKTFYFGSTKISAALTNDVFINSDSAIKNGLNALVNITSGKFGTICSGSKPLKNFFIEFNAKKLEKLLQKGISTNKYGHPHSFLKTLANNPISTSYVHDCSVIYLYNNNKNTHFLYHASPFVEKKTVDFMINKFMKEGYSKAFIIPGDNDWTERHLDSLPVLFDTIKENNPQSIINICHNSSKYPEIVGYNGSVYELPNKGLTKDIHGETYDNGQTSFKVSDIQECYILDKIKYNGNTTLELNQLKKLFAEKGYDNEIQKVLSELINERQKEIDEIEQCKTFEELKKCVEMHSPSYVVNHFKVFDRQKEFIRKLSLFKRSHPTNLNET